MSTENELKTLTFLKTWKPLKNGTAPIFIRITLNGERVEFGLKESTLPTLWVQMPVKLCTCTDLNCADKFFQ